MASYTDHVTFFFIVVLSLLSVPSHCADPDPLQDFCIADYSSGVRVNGYPCRDPSTVTSKDFFYEGFNAEKVFNTYGTNITMGNVNLFAGLNTLGTEVDRIEFLEGGLNPPHTHPRATELVLLVKGTLLAGLVTTQNVFYYKVITPETLFIIPRGLLHFQMNIGKGRAIIYAIFNSQNPGVQNQATAHFNTTPPIPVEVLMKAFKVNQSMIEALKSALSVPFVSEMQPTWPISSE